MRWLLPSACMAEWIKSRAVTLLGSIWIRRNRAQLGVWGGGGCGQLNRPLFGAGELVAISGPWIIAEHLKIVELKRAAVKWQVRVRLTQREVTRYCVLVPTISTSAEFKVIRYTAIKYNAKLYSIVTMHKYTGMAIGCYKRSEYGPSRLAAVPLLRPAAI